MTSFFRKALLLALGFWLMTFAVLAQQAPALGTFYDYSVVGYQGVNNKGRTIVGASLGAVQQDATGFPPGIINRERHERNAAAAKAHQDAAAAFAAASGKPATTTLTNPNLGGRTFTPGVYRLNGDANLAGELTLSGENNPNAVFIFHIKGDLATNFNAQMVLTRDASSAYVFWVVEGGISFGGSSSLIGNFIAKKNAVLNDGVALKGRVASLQGEVELNNNRLSIPADLSVTIVKTPGANGTNRYVVGESITYTITAKNLGPVDEDMVKVTDIQFTGESPSYTSTAPGSVFARDPVTGRWLWNIGKLEYGQEVKLVITTTITGTGNGFIRGVISGAGVDEIRYNNNAELNFCVVLPDAGTISGPKELCVGATGVYSVEPVEGVPSYNWIVPSDWEYNIEDPEKPYIITVTAGRNKGVISVTVNNTCGESLPSRLAVNNFADPPVKPGPITANEGICAGSSATYSIAPVANASAYTWTVPADWTITAGQGTTDITVLAGKTAGKVTVMAENVCGFSPASEREVKPFLEKPALPGAISGTGTVSFCATAERLTYTINAQGDATEYLWEVPASWTIIEGQGTTTIVVKPSPTGGTVSVRAVNACGQGPAKTFEVTPVPGPPAVPGVISGDFPVCAGSKGVKYSIEPVATASGYTWYVPSGWTITAGQGTNEITVTVGAGATGGKIIVQANNVCGASGRSSKDVTITTGAPTAPLEIRGSAFGCAATSVTYETDPVANASSYTWTVPQGWTITAGQGTTRITVTMGTQSGNVTVRASNSCGNSPEKSLAVRPFTAPPAKPFAIKGSLEVCIGQKTAVYSLEPVDHTLEYIWAVPQGWTITAGQGTTSITVAVGTTSGNITVTASNPCGDSAPATLAVTPVPDVPAAKPGAITGETQYCAGTNQVYFIDRVEGAVSYHWTFPGADWEIVSGQGTTRVTVKAGASAGQVTVAAINKCGTPGTSTGLTVKAVGGVPPAPSAIISSTSSYCANTTNLTFRVSAVASALSYTWTVPAGWTITAGQGTTQITVKAGNAGGEVTVVANNSCGQSQSTKLVTAPQQTLPTPGAIQGASLPCVGSTELVYTVPAVEGAETYLWTVPADWAILEGAGTNRIRVRVGGKGTITVKARNACGTTAASSLVIDIVAARPGAPVAISGAGTVCAGRTATYTIGETANSSSYTWTVPAGWTITVGQGTTRITVVAGTTAGDITVEALNGCGKSAAAKLAVSGTQLSSVSRIVDRTVRCAGEAVYEVEQAIPGVTYTWTVPADWTITAGQGTGSIRVAPGKSVGEIAVVADNGICQTEPTTFKPEPFQPNTELVLPNVFTPNNDGNNDAWEITNLHDYPDNDLVVMNRWGNEVYKSKSYKNNWSGDNLAEGTYYYVLRVKLCDGADKVYKGYVMLVR
ncbi:T9SS C-terminal target domain-containing protein [Pontibacter roseus]|uniref:T9SS C-terminal target domain-containing protein n=1 Tax=Pontibacter roseus TaxID=336989 RepID=UPI00035CB8BB|nr:T9SS C-terminal target domain-containing protein [Pontibacter roseus]